MSTFDDSQLEPAGDLGDGLTGWWVDFGESYRGKAVAPIEWSRAQVVDALNMHAGRLTPNVLKGRLYSRFRLDRPNGHA